MQKTTDRAIFANQLRAIAITAVIIVHWCGIYWYARDTVASYIFAPPVIGPSSSMILWLTLPTFNYGPFGVAIFFLISGFVIPFSLSRLSPKEFLISRAFRIYPTYVTASLIMLCIAYLSSKYWAVPFHLSIKTIITNLLLINGDVFRPSIDLVNWTLSIEIKFYLLSALLYKSIRSGAMSSCILLSIAILAFCELGEPLLTYFGIAIRHISIDAIKTELMCVTFMFIGSVFYHHYTGTKTVKESVTLISSLLVIFVLCWPHTSWQPQIPSVTQNYIYALILFTACYSLRSYFRPIPGLDFIANISYSIYVLHSIIGYISIRFFMDQGCSFPIAGLITLILVLALSYALHIWVEVPTMHIGKKLAKRHGPKHLAEQPTVT